MKPSEVHPFQLLLWRQPQRDRPSLAGRTDRTDAKRRRGQPGSTFCFISHTLATEVLRMLVLPPPPPVLRALLPAAAGSRAPCGHCPGNIGPHRARDGTVVGSGLAPRQRAWEHSPNVIRDGPVLNGTLAALEWQDTSPPCSPGGEKVKYISHYRKKPQTITEAIKFRISRTIIFTPCDGC